MVAHEIFPARIMDLCPKCGSDKIMHDQCLRCGVIISKARTDRPPPSQISYVDPGPTTEPPKTEQTYAWRSPALPERMDSFESGHTARNTGKIITLLVLLALSGLVYYIYNYFMHQASAYAGFYKNTKYSFALTFPNKGWYHYTPSDIREDAFKDANDAFYSGDSPRDPDILLVIWVEALPQPVPDRLDEDTASRIIKVLQEEFQKRMKKSNLESEITETGRKMIGGNDGFYLRANLKNKKNRVKTFLYCAYSNRNAYTVQFIGDGKHLIEREGEIENMISGFSFRMSII